MVFVSCPTVNPVEKADKTTWVILAATSIAARQSNLLAWPFTSFFCTLLHGTLAGLLSTSALSKRRRATGCYRLP